MAKYSYDAYGNTKVLNPNGTGNTSSSFIGNINPIRYRSYYYDNETGFYYCKSRYYVPKLRRWLTPDNPSYLDNNNLNGINLYSYCNNNPIMYFDETGKSAVITLLISVGIGIILGAIGGTANAILSDYNDDDSINGSIGQKAYFGNIVGGAISGAAIGFSSGAGSLWLGPLIAGGGTATAALGSLVASSCVSFTGGFVSYCIEKAIVGGAWTLNEALFSASITALEGVLSFGVSGLSSLITWEDGRMLHIGKISLNLPQTSAQNFVSDIFGNPIGWLLDLLMEYY